MLKSVDHRTDIPEASPAERRVFTLSPDVFLVRKVQSDLEGSSPLRRALSANLIEVLNEHRGDISAATNLLVKVNSDLEGGSLEDMLAGDPLVKEIFPALETPDGEVRAARLNRIVISLNSTSATDRAIFAKHYGLVLVRFNRAGNVGVYELLGGKIEDALRQMEHESLVRYAEPDFIVDDSDFEDRRGAGIQRWRDIDDSVLWNHAIIGLDEARSAADGTGVVVAVVDGRCRADHEALKEVLVADSEAFEFAPGHVPYFIDHGTQVAGIVGGRRVGVAPKCTILPVSIVTNSDGEYASRAEALQEIAKIRRKGTWLDRRSRKTILVDRMICNCSWQVSDPPPIVVEEALIGLDKAGAIICSSAGNSGKEKRHYPSDYDFCISVAAVGPDGLKADYSNFGDLIDVSGPGGHDDPKPGPEDPEGSSEILSCSFDGEYTLDTGTSFSSPHIAGVLALMWSVAPHASASRIKEVMLAGGVVDVYALNPAYRGKLGSGAIHAGRCVEAARRLARA